MTTTMRNGGLFAAALVAVAAIFAMALVAVAGNAQEAYADEGPSSGAITAQAATASKTCALYTSKGALVRCTSQGKQVSGNWGGTDELVMPQDLTTLFIANDVKSIKESASITYIANAGSNAGKTLKGKQQISDVNMKKLVFLTDSKGANSCTSIASEAFKNCDRLKTIKGLEKAKIATIGSLAFYANESLTSISLPATLKTIGTECFSGCSKLKRVNGLKKTRLTSIPEDAFYGCAALKSVALGKKLTSIGKDAFARCDKLASIDLPSSVREIGESAFSGCASLKKVKIRSKSLIKTSDAASLFSSTPIATSKMKAYIYVPKSIVAKYKSSSKWKEYKTKFKAL